MNTLLQLLLVNNNAVHFLEEAAIVFGILRKETIPVVKKNLTMKNYQKYEEANNLYNHRT